LAEEEEDEGNKIDKIINSAEHNKSPSLEKTIPGSPTDKIINSFAT